MSSGTPKADSLEQTPSEPATRPKSPSQDDRQPATGDHRPERRREEHGNRGPDEEPGFGQGA